MFAALLTALALAALAAAAPAAAGNRILFATQGRLEAVSPHGGSPHLLRYLPRGTVDVAASASGRRLALIANRRLPYPQHGSERTLYLLRLGHGLRKVASFHGEGALDIAISPRGDQIAFDRNAELWTVDVDGRHQRQVTSGAGVAFQPAYMPDGRGLVFVRSPRGTPELFRVRFGSSREFPLGGGEARMPAVARDGRIAYFASREGPGPERIVVMRADGSGRRTVDRSYEPVFDTEPAFSPNGRSLTFQRLNERGGHSEDYRYSILTVTTRGANRRLVVGGLRAGPGRQDPIGPLWVPAG
ncbi:MAG TPA: hypothetical protein VFI17_07715 [Solirubrobacterales bacterium]|nr:hypothetical protein [Solirubrobacterales bacterium]